MNERVEIIVHGKVQLVMYRDFANRKARALGLVGEVRNLSDGTVRVVAEGDHTTLQKFITKLRSGPMLARVERLDITTVPPTGEYSSFNIACLNTEQCDSVRVWNSPFSTKTRMSLS